MATEANIWQPKTIVQFDANLRSIEQKFTATAGQYLFTLTDFAYSVGTGALELYKDGLRLALAYDFTEQTTTTFQLAAACVGGEEIIAVGKVGISSTVDVRDTNIYVANYQAIRDYAGVEALLFSMGTVTTNDGGESFFQYFSGAAAGTYVDDNALVIVPTGGDGSAAWFKANSDLIMDISTEVAAGDADFTISNAKYDIVVLDTTAWTQDRAVILSTRVKLTIVDNTANTYSATVKPTAGGTGVVIPAGERKVVWCDGSTTLYDLLVSNKDKQVTYNMLADATYPLTTVQNSYGRIEITDTTVVLTTKQQITVDNAVRSFVAINSTLQNLVYKTAAGTGIIVGAGTAAKLYNDGTNIVLAEPTSVMSSSSALTPHKNLVITNNAATPNSKVDVSADLLELDGMKVTNVALNIDITASGANGLDTGAEANSTWYHIWAISDGTSVAGLLSTSATAPTMPAGYTFKGYVGAIYNNGSGNFITVVQKNKIVSATSVYDLTGGTALSYTSVTLTVPSTAESAFGYGANSFVGSQVTIFIATTSSGLSETPLTVGAAGATTTNVNGYFSLPLIESQTLYYKVSSLSSSGAIRTGGWEY